MQGVWKNIHGKHFIGATYANTHRTLELLLPDLRKRIQHCYKIHMRSHQGLKYCCQYCGKSFVKKQTHYRPQRSCDQGYVFTRVCHSVNRRGSASVHAGIPPPWSRGTCSCTQDNTSTTVLFAGKDLMKAQITRPTWEFMRASSLIAIIAPNPLWRSVRYRIIYRNILDNIDSRVTSVVKDSTRKLTMINTLNTISHNNTEDNM